MLCKWDASIITSLLVIITSLLRRSLLLPIITHFSLPNLQMDAVPERAVKRLANAVEGRILSAAAARHVKLEKGIQKQFVRQLQVGHVPRKGYVCRAILLPVQGLYLTIFRVLLLKNLACVRAAQLLKLGAEACDANIVFHLQLGLLRLIRRKMLQPSVQRNEGVLDTLDELGLVRHLPGLEGPEEVQEQRRKVLGKLVRHVGKRGIHCNLVADALKGLYQWISRVKERLLERAHRLKDPGRVVRDHKARKEDAHIDMFRYKGR